MVLPLQLISLLATSSHCTLPMRQSERWSYVPSSSNHPLEGHHETLSSQLPHEMEQQVMMQCTTTCLLNYMPTSIEETNCAMCETVIVCAVSGLDYEAVSEEMLEFVVGQTRACHTVTINQDNVCELLPSNEYFFSDLAYESGVPVINIDPQTARVIIADTDEPECGECSYYERGGV